MTDNSTENEDALEKNMQKFFAILNGEDKEKTRAAQQDHMRDGINMCTKVQKKKKRATMT